MDTIKGDVGEDGQQVAVGKDISETSASSVVTGDKNRVRRHEQRQHTSVNMAADRDAVTLLYSVEREMQVIHREIATVKAQLQNAFYTGLLIIIVVVGLAVFIGDRQITRIDQRVYDVELQLRRIEQQMQRNQHVPPFGELP